MAGWNRRRRGMAAGVMLHNGGMRMYGHEAEPALLCTYPPIVRIETEIRRLSAASADLRVPSRGRPYFTPLRPPPSPIRPAYEYAPTRTLPEPLRFAQPPIGHSYLCVNFTAIAVDQTPDSSFHPSPDDLFCPRHEYICLSRMVPSAGSDTLRTAMQTEQNHSFDLQLFLSTPERMHRASTSESEPSPHIRCLIPAAIHRPIPLIPSIQDISLHPAPHWQSSAAGRDACAYLSCAPASAYFDLAVRFKRALSVSCNQSYRSLPSAFIARGNLTPRSATRRAPPHPPHQYVHHLARPGQVSQATAMSGISCAFATTPIWCAAHTSADALRLSALFPLFPATVCTTYRAPSHRLTPPGQILYMAPAERSVPQLPLCPVHPSITSSPALDLRLDRAPPARTGQTPYQRGAASARTPLVPELSGPPARCGSRRQRHPPRLYTVSDIARRLDRASRQCTRLRLQPRRVFSRFSIASACCRSEDVPRVRTACARTRYDHEFAELRAWAFNPPAHAPLYEHSGKSSAHAFCAKRTGVDNDFPPDTGRPLIARPVHRLPRR
ncbi:hypothetical protein HYPSUDRAFT_219013 [Hypholoma sublateritium FD-334 SS-4]|uniref:Uncharacterized protein n=1 Tax=Hypholoma sublateritium (strain FD-334 SS-4) TaxID=945553 RepID=A0A0D2NE29_HYPSF|nr:hypothetical protein HYPSUDRAFT_219013 [Hypholoma sublateritium FD-334 SS-4]